MVPEVATSARGVHVSVSVFVPPGGVPLSNALLSRPGNIGAGVISAVVEHAVSGGNQQSATSSTPTGGGAVQGAEAGCIHALRTRDRVPAYTWSRDDGLCLSDILTCSSVLATLSGGWRTDRDRARRRGLAWLRRIYIHIVRAWLRRVDVHVVRPRVHSSPIG